ncbi:MAG: DUF6128 domain-containing protein [Lachnospiraceae bacterium]|nr:DUF6128 domain-containing protein [Lachnospiraceae bacterium]
MVKEDKGFYDKKIVYLDYLERNSKVKNGGFLKWEAKGETSRIQIHIRGLYPTDTMQGEIQIISRGEIYPADSILLKYGTGEYAAVWKNEELAGTAISYTECDGIQIRLSEKRVLKGIWREREKETVAGNAAEILQETPQTVEIEPKPLWKEPEAVEEVYKAAKETTETVKKLTEAVKDPADAAKETAEAAKELTETIKEPGESAKETEAWKEAAEAEAIRETESADAEIIRRAEPADAEIIQRTEPADAEIIQRTEPADAGEVEKADLKEDKETEEPAAYEHNEGKNWRKTHQTRQKQYAEKTEQLSDDKWEQLGRHYPRIHPFGDEREYLSITPRDFVVLSRQYQNLVQNSFLLHGYYNYGHVILTKIKEREEDSFYLGVPGVYFDREKQAALMFGFEGFEAGTDLVAEGGFGYYMKRVEI